jgi:hypothetical protein
MTEIPVNFLSSRLPIVGVVAYSIYSPHGDVESHCLSKSFYPTSTEHMLKAAVESSRTLLPADEVAAQYCWVFECLRVYIATRPDGACLALLVENNPGAQTERIQEALQSFAEMEPVEVTA